jgi:hypothetical protein
MTGFLLGCPVNDWLMSGLIIIYVAAVFVLNLNVFISMSVAVNLACKIALLFMGNHHACLRTEHGLALCLKKSADCRSSFHFVYNDLLPARTC